MLENKPEEPYRCNLLALQRMKQIQQAWASVSVPGFYRETFETFTLLWIKRITVVSSRFR